MWITNKDPLYTTWNSILVMAYMGKESYKKRSRYIGITDPPYSTPETNITL